MIWSCMYSAKASKLPSPEKIGCFVLCGGRGTRIKALYPGVPKIMLPVHGRPFLELFLERMADWGIDDVTLCTGVGGGAISDWAARRPAGMPRVEILNEAEPRGTLLPVRAAFASTGVTEALICNGDTIIQGDVRSMTQRPLDVPVERCRIGITEVSNTNERGVACVRGDRLISFERGSGGRGMVSNGLVRLHVDGLKDVEASTTSLDGLVSDLALKGQATAVPAGRGFIDIGTPSGYEEYCASR